MTIKIPHRHPNQHRNDASDLVALSEAIAALTPLGMERLIETTDSAWAAQPRKRVRFFQNLRTLLHLASDPRLVRYEMGLSDELMAMIERSHRRHVDVSELH